MKVQVAAEASRRPRVLYHRNGEVFQRDLPKGSDLDASFEYWSVPAAGKGAKGPAVKAPLEMELKSEQGRLETSAEHTLKLQPTGDGWEVDYAARIQVKAAAQGGDHLDLQLPRLRPLNVGPLGASPTSPYPASVPWL